MAATVGRDAVVVDVAGMMAGVRATALPAGVLDALRERLSMEHLRFASGGRLGYRGVPERVAFFVEPDEEWEDRDWILFPRGAAESVARLLRREGLVVEIRDRRPDHLPPRPLEALDAELFPTIDAAVRFRCGVMEARDEADAVSEAAAICRWFDGTRVAFPCRSWRRAWRLREQLSEHLPDQVAVHDRTRTVAAPYVVGSYASLLAMAQYWEDYMVLCLDGRGLVGRSATWMLDCMLRPGNRRRPVQRVFAILPVRDLRRMSPLERRRLELLYGPTLVHLLPAAASVEVAFVTTPSCRTVTAQPGLDFKRAAFWKNDRRNDFVAAVARAVADGDRTKLRRYGISPPVDSPTVAVLVESPEHAGELQSRLPDWEIRSRSAGEGRPVGHQAIVTQIEATRVGVAVDVLVNAMNGPAIGLRDFPPKRLRVGDTVLLVDFDDLFDDRAQAETRTRRAAYRRAGWDVQAEDAGGRADSR